MLNIAGVIWLVDPRGWSLSLTLFVHKHLSQTGSLALTLQMAEGYRHTPTPASIVIGWAGLITRRRNIHNNFMQIWLVCLPPDYEVCCKNAVILEKVQSINTWVHRNGWEKESHVVFLWDPDFQARRRCPQARLKARLGTATTRGEIVIPQENNMWFSYSQAPN